jgi:Spx/MgsR family transcriptional regulator
MPVKLYGLAKCSTCIKARSWLDAQGIPYAFQDYRDIPVDPETLKAWAESLGGWEKLVNRASITWRNLDERFKSPTSDKEWLSLVALYPALIRRPVTVYADHSVTVGFNEKRYAEKLGQA